MNNMAAMIIGSIAGFLPHLIFGKYLSFFADFMVSTMFGGAVYVYAMYKIKNMQ